MSNRKEYLSRIEKEIGKRNLIWFGVRGDDASPLLALPQFNTCYSFIAPIPNDQLEHQICLESLTKHRVDLNMYDAGDDKSNEFDFLYREFLNSCDKPSVLASYSSWPIITAARFTRAEKVQFLGMLHDQRNRFENRAWVETELRKGDIPVVPWIYISNYDDLLLRKALKTGQQILRSNRSSGGTGFVLIAEEGDIPDLATSDNRLFAFAPYLFPNIPLNINGCVFPSGDITLHAPSLQLVGINSCTHKPFGYCGNDFARIKELEQGVLTEMERISFRTAQWLHRKGYIGAFGLDLILYDGKLLVSEINPRFQGSSKLAGVLDLEMGLVDMFMAHLAAFLGLDAPDFTHIVDLVNNQREISQIYCSNEFGGMVQRNENTPAFPENIWLQTMPSRDIIVEKGATLFKLTTFSSVSKDGLSLIPEYNTQVERMSKEMFSKV